MRSTRRQNAAHLAKQKLCQETQGMGLAKEMKNTTRAERISCTPS